MSFHVFVHLYLHMNKYCIPFKRTDRYGLLDMVELQKVTFARIKDVDLVRTRDIQLTYYEMAEVSSLGISLWQTRSCPDLLFPL